jgi:hypothetical protein
MAKDKTIFYHFSGCNTKQIFVGDNRSLTIAVSRTVQLNDGHCNDVL